MNKPLLLIAALACFAAAHSQFPYSATVLNEYYVSLDNPTSLGIEVGWDDPKSKSHWTFPLISMGTTRAAF